MSNKSEEPSENMKEYIRQAKESMAPCPLAQDGNGERRTRFGEVAYTAYCVAVGGKAWNGDPLPTWNEMLDTPEKAHLVVAWNVAGDAAAQAAINSLFQRVLEEDK